MRDQVFVLRLDNQTLKALEHLAAATERSKAGVLRYLVRQAAGVLTVPECRDRQAAEASNDDHER